MKVLNDTKIGVRLGTAFGFLVLIILIIGGLSVNRMELLGGLTQKFYKHPFAVREAVLEVETEIVEIHRSMKDVALAKSAEAIEKHAKIVDEKEKEIIKQFEIIKDRFLGDKAMYETALSEIKSWKPIRDNVIRFMKEGNLAAAADITRGEGVQKLKKIDEKMSILGNFAKDKAGGFAKSADAIQKFTVMLMYIILGVAVLLAVVIAFLISRSISRPILMGLEFSEKLAKGDLTARIDLDQKDELGQLGKALNNAAESLESVVSNVILSTRNLAEAVEQIASGNQNLSQRTSEQASSLEEISSTVEEATASTNQNAENASKANVLSEKSYKLAEDGGKISDEAVQGINEISDVSKKIGDITSVINEISFQTNLLALNAAVEAARAGEAGRGFAVVAGEIRNLAQRSGNAAKEIEVLIKDTVSKIDNGSELVIKSGEALKQIFEGIEEVTRTVNEIAIASEEQKSGMDQLNTAVTEMDNMTQENAALVEETASAGEEMSNQAQELLNMTGSFKVNGGTKRKSITSGHSDIHLNIAGRNGNGNGNGSKKRNALQVQGHKTGSDIKQVMAQDGFEEF